MSKIENAVQFMLNIANDNTHGYSRENRWGPDYDCSSLMVTAWQSAGVPVKTKGATYTGNMLKPFLACGFKNVTAQCNLSTAAGMQRGDVLLSPESSYGDVSRRQETRPCPVHGRAPGSRRSVR